MIPTAKERALKTVARCLSLAWVRPLSSYALSSWVSSLLKRNVRIFCDSVWLRSDGNVAIALGPNAPVRRNEILRWKPAAAELTELAASFWYLFYKPAKGDVILDIGAGMGEDTILFAASVGDAGLVYSFEAHPMTAVCLAKTIEHSKLSNAVPVHAAIYDKTCTLKIEDRSDDQWQENSVIPLDSRQHIRAFEVPAFPLDQFEPLSKHDSIAFIKMNIEGAEVDALHGMTRTLAKTKAICVACHDFLSAKNPKMKTKSACRQLLQDAGFIVQDTDPNSPPWQRDHLHAIRPPA